MSTDKTVCTATDIAKDKAWMTAMTDCEFPDAERYQQDGVWKVKYPSFEKLEWLFSIDINNFFDKYIECWSSHNKYKYNAKKGFYALFIQDTVVLHGFPVQFIPRASPTSFITENDKKSGIIVNSVCAASVNHGCPSFLTHEILYADMSSCVALEVPVKVTLSSTRCIHVDGFRYGCCAGTIRNILASDKPRKMIMNSLDAIESELFFYMNRTVCAFLYLRCFVT